LAEKDFVVMFLWYLSTSTKFFYNSYTLTLLCFHL
jgi:hypothetical protein